MVPHTDRVLYNVHYAFKGCTFYALRRFQFQHEQATRARHWELAIKSYTDRPRLRQAYLQRLVMVLPWHRLQRHASMMLRSPAPMSPFLRPELQLH